MMPGARLARPPAAQLAWQEGCFAHKATACLVIEQHGPAAQQRHDQLGQARLEEQAPHRGTQRPHAATLPICCAIAAQLRRVLQLVARQRLINARGQGIDAPGRRAAKGSRRACFCGALLRQLMQCVGFLRRGRGVTGRHGWVGLTAVALGVPIGRGWGMRASSLPPEPPSLDAAQGLSNQLVFLQLTMRSSSSSSGVSRPSTSTKPSRSSWCRQLAATAAISILCDHFAGRVGRIGREFGARLLMFDRCGACWAGSSEK